MLDKELAWRVEKICLKAWPALRQVVVDDWVLQFSRGLTRRANSANPLCDVPCTSDAAIAACENLYRAEGLPPLFRLPTFIAPLAQRRLMELGYRPEGESCAIHADIASVARASDSDAEIFSNPNADWLATIAHLQGHNPEKSRTYNEIVNSIMHPAAFVRFQADGKTAAQAYGVVYDRLLCIESVVTNPAYRKRGYARGMLTTLIRWAKSQDATGVCLQVEATNTPAKTLYYNLGLKTELYRYSYFRSLSLS